MKKQSIDQIRDFAKACLREVEEAIRAGMPEDYVAQKVANYDAAAGMLAVTIEHSDRP